MQPPLFDTHCHLTWNEKGDSAKHLWKEARDCGVKQMVSIGINLNDSIRARELSVTLEGVFATVGIHPNDLGAKDVLPTLLSQLDSLAREGGWSGIGESGLDLYRDWCPADIQREGLQRHLSLASELKLPIVLHCREAGAELLEELHNFNRPITGVMHCFSDGPERVEEFLALGLHISFAGNLTYPNASDIRDSALMVPSNRLLVETDAPFLSPQPKRGKKNRPAYVRDTFDFLAELRAEDSHSLAQQLCANSERLFASNN